MSFLDEFASKYIDGTGADRFAFLFTRAIYFTKCQKDTHDGRPPESAGRVLASPEQPPKVYRLQDPEVAMYSFCCVRGAASRMVGGCRDPHVKN